MYKPDLVLINLEWLICHKTKANPFFILTDRSDFHMIDNLSRDVC